jgi:sigma-54 dependent transcriptional regulator, acetoin dehydrogenase operon transcriptional activator AcoR
MHIEEDGMTEIIGQSASIKKAISLAEKFANSPHLILIAGETGTGKELIAQHIHGVGKRKGKFIKVSVPNVSELLWDSEFLGYGGGTFTGAISKGKKGYIELAKNGDLFLDEVGIASPVIQEKLLSILQDKNFTIIGGREIHSTARIIAATNADLKTMVREKRMRSDLYYRLNVLKIHVPPLRERSGDITLLANHFLNKYRAAFNQKLDNSAIDFLNKQCWPGNVRQLENLIKTVCFSIDSPDIKKADILSIMDGDVENEIEYEYDKYSLDYATKKAVERALEKTNGNRSRAAKLLEISRRALLRRIETYKIKR